MAKSAKSKTDQRAEAIKAVARTASKAIDSANAVGRFLERVFGSVLEDTVGLAGDPLRAFRLKRLAELQKKTDEYLAAKGVEATQPISPRLGHKVVHEASLEDVEELHSRFARFLAEALDPHGEKVTRKHADVLCEMTSQSFVILDYCWKHRREYGHVVLGRSDIQYEQVRAPLATRSLSEVVHATKTHDDDVRHLVQLGLFRPSGNDFHVFPWTRDRMGDVRTNERLERVTIYQDLEAFEFTEFGLEFCRAVVAPIER